MHSPILWIRHIFMVWINSVNRTVAMWTVPNILLTIFGLVLMVTPLALWVAWTITIFIGVLVAALISLIGAVIVTRIKN